MNSEKEYKHSTILNSPAYELFILGLCVIAVVIVAEETFSSLGADVLYILRTVDFLICVVFLTDFFFRLFMAENRLKYLFTWGWLDLISSIPAIEFFRLGRLARVVRVLRILKGVRSIRALSEHVSASRSEYAFSLATLITVTTVLTGSVAVLVFEADSGSNIQSGKEAIWWTVVTMTSVGYGDFVPVTTGGRVVGMILMTVGVAIFATYSGFVATILLQPAETKQYEELDEIRKEISLLRKHLTQTNQRPPDDENQQEST